MRTLFFKKEGMSKRVRNFSLVLHIVNASLLAYFFWILKAPLLLTGSMVALSLATALLFLINCRWKASAHATAISHCLTVLLFAFGPKILSLFLLLLPLAWSRIILKAHTVAQIAFSSLMTPGITILVLKGAFRLSV